MPEKLLTVKECAEILGVNKNKVYDLIRFNLLPAIKLGRLKIRPQVLEQFIQEYEGQDLNDLTNIHPINVDEEDILNGDTFHSTKKEIEI